MKKSFAILSICFIICSLFTCGKKKDTVSVKNRKDAPNIEFAEPITDYKTLMQEAQEYEQNENFVYALGYYYDASQAKNISEEEKAAAIQAFDLLGEKLESGDVGLKEQNAFGIHDALVVLRFEMYYYFTEFCAYEFVFDSFKQTDVDYESRTAEYLAQFKCRFSDKTEKIMSLVSKSYSKLPYHELKLWKDAVINEEDFNTNYSETIIQSGYISNGLPFFNLNNSNISDDFLVSSLVTLDYYRGKLRYGSLGYSLYFFDFTVLDSNGNKIQQFKNYPCIGISLLDFSDGTIESDFTKYDASNRIGIKRVPSQYMKDFEEGTISFRLDALYLPYGSFPYGEGTVDNIQYAKKVEMPVRENILKFKK